MVVFDFQNGMLYIGPCLQKAHRLYNSLFLNNNVGDGHNQRCASLFSFAVWCGPKGLPPVPSREVDSSISFSYHTGK